MVCGVAFKVWHVECRTNPGIVPYFLPPPICICICMCIRMVCPIYIYVWRVGACACTPPSKQFCMPLTLLHHLVWSVVLSDMRRGSPLILPSCALLYPPVPSLLYSPLPPSDPLSSPHTVLTVPHEAQDAHTFASSALHLGFPDAPKKGASMPPIIQEGCLHATLQIPIQP